MRDILANLPATWDRKRLKFTSRIDTSGVWGEEAGENEVDLPTVTTANIDRLGRFDLSNANVRSFSKNVADYYRCAPGDIVVVKSSGSATNIISGKCAQASTSDGDFCFGNFTLRLRANRDIVDDRFLFFFLTSGVTVERIKIMVSTTTYPNLKVGEYIGHEIPLPPLETQQRIARFLDEKTARIDALIEKKRELLDRLAEKRQALITKAVTKGLNPDAPMKPSGIDWLGDIPAHWEVKQLKYISPKVSVGIVVTPAAYYADEGVLAIRGLNIRPMGFDFAEIRNISEDGHVLHLKSELYEGDLVAVRTGDPGTTSIITSDLEGSNCVDLVIIRKPRNASSRFLGWFLNSNAAKVQYSMGSEGALQLHFNVETSKAVVVSLPPADEQDKIATYIDSSLEFEDCRAAKVEKSVGFLLEYRAALITSAVTGQIQELI